MTAKQHQRPEWQGRDLRIVLNVEYDASAGGDMAVIEKEYEWDTP